VSDTFGAFQPEGNSAEGSVGAGGTVSGGINLSTHFHSAYDFSASVGFFTSWMHGEPP